MSTFRKLRVVEEFLGAFLFNCLQRQGACSICKFSSAESKVTFATPVESNLLLAAKDVNKFIAYIKFTNLLHIVFERDIIDFRVECWNTVESAQKNENKATQRHTSGMVWLIFYLLDRRVYFLNTRIRQWPCAVVTTAHRSIVQRPYERIRMRKFLYLFAEVTELKKFSFPDARVQVIFYGKFSRFPYFLLYRRLEISPLEIIYCRRCVRWSAASFSCQAALLYDGPALHSLFITPAAYIYTRVCLCTPERLYFIPARWLVGNWKQARQ